MMKLQPSKVTNEWRKIPFERFGTTSPYCFIRPLENRTKRRPFCQPLENWTPLENQMDPYHCFLNMLVFEPHCISRVASRRKRFTVIPGPWNAIEITWRNLGFSHQLTQVTRVDLTRQPPAGTMQLRWFFNCNKRQNLKDLAEIGLGNVALTCRLRF